MRKILCSWLAVALTACITCAKHSSVIEPPIDSSPPNPPSNLFGLGLSSSTIALAWVDNSDDETYFIIYKYDDVADSFFICQRQTANITKFVDTNLPDSSEYRYYVVAQKGDSSSSPSNMVIVRTLSGGMTVAGFSYFQSPSASIDLYNSFVLVGTQNARLYPVEISDPANPHLGMAYQAPAGIRWLQVNGDIAIMALGLSGMQTMTIQDPSNPRLLGSCDTPGNVSAVCIVSQMPQGFFYYALEGSLIQIIEANNLYQMNIVGEFRSPSSPVIYDAISDLASVYLACGDSGLQILDYADALHPTIIGRLQVPGGARKLFLSDEAFHPKLYLLNGISSFYIIDIMNRLSPTIIGFFNVGANPSALHVDGNYAYVSYVDGFKIIDISDPASPTYVAFYQDSGISSIKAANGYIYVADNNGLRILQYRP